MDGVWGSCLQPSQGLFWYRIPDSELLSAICRVYNDWIADFCKPYPDRLKGIAMLNVDDVEEASQELERCAKLGLVGAFIPVSPLADGRIVTRSTTASGGRRRTSGIPLLLHIGTPRGGVPGYEFTMNLAELTGAGRSTTDYWVRYSLCAMIFAGVFDRYPRLKVGSVEHEAAWIPHWLKQMDFTYRERPVFTKGWRSKEGLLPSDYWRRNMFVEFMEDDLGVQLRDQIGVENMLWGSDFPHAESTWPKSRDFLEPHVRGRARGGSAQDHLGERRADVRLHAGLGCRLVRPRCWTASCRWPRRPSCRQGRCSGWSSTGSACCSPTWAVPSTRCGTRVVTGRRHCRRGRSTATWSSVRCTSRPSTCAPASW